MPDVITIACKCGWTGKSYELWEDHGKRSCPKCRAPFKPFPTGNEVPSFDIRRWVNEE